MESVMKNEHEVIGFLQENLGRSYCGRCLSEKTTAGSPNQIKRLIKALLENRREYDDGNPCDFCDEPKQLCVAFLPGA